ncbi:hypothetical protein N9A28_03555 [Sulfurimonas sp.]|nr:hypothetical protein [Sulfurimonas sp.]
MYDNYEPDYSLYEPEPPSRLHYIEDVQTPIKPSILATEVVRQLQSYGLQVPTRTPEMVEELCKGFNRCIELNSTVQDAQTYVFSPKTGSAKSVTAKMYTSMLTQEASIIVVSTIADAIDFCEDINAWARDNDYARCYYSKDDKKSLRVEKQDLSKYRCIVITHNMFIRENNNKQHGYFKKYNGMDRTLVIIDERISMYNRFTIDKTVVEDLVRILTVLKAYIKPNMNKYIEMLKQVLKLFDDVFKLSQSPKESLVNLLLDKTKREQLSIPKCDFEHLKIAIDDMTKNLHSILNPVRSKKNSEEDKALRVDIKNYLDAIEIVVAGGFSYHKSGLYSYLMSTESLISKFGTSVVLDATAEVNEIYNTTAWHNPDTFKHIDTIDPRKYNNFTIHKAPGYKQGKTAIYDGLSKDEVEVNVHGYLNIARQILTKPTDKLLIICHQEFEDKLKKGTQDKRIEFTHWGNHVGKNKWSHCNKVLVIGWNQFRSVEYYGNFINAVGDLDYASLSLFTDMEKIYRNSQLADDLVQAVMRGSARKTIDTDGNCYKCDAYILYPDNDMGNAVMELFESQFKDANIVKWYPKVSLTSKKISAGEKNLEKIMKYLDSVSNTTKNVSQSDIVKGTNLSKAIVSRALKHKSRPQLFKDKGYKMEKGEQGQATKITLLS